MVIDLVVIYDLGTPSEFSTTAKVYPPSNSRIILTALGDGTNFGGEQEHFLEYDLAWWPYVTMLTCHEKRGDTCHLETSANVIAKWMPGVMNDKNTTYMN
jgi:hypothetical protein